MTVDGTVVGPADDRFSKAPPSGDGPLSVNVAVEDAPPTTDVGLRVRPESAAGLMVKVALWAAPVVAALMLATI